MTEGEKRWSIYCDLVIEDDEMLEAFDRSPTVTGGGADVCAGRKV